MTKDDALKLALEALEEAHYKHEHRQDATKRGQAITAIEAALAQPSDSVEKPIDFELAYGEIYKDQRAALAKALAQPEQEPETMPSAREAQLLHELRYISSISTGQVKRVTDAALLKALALTSTTCEVQPEQEPECVAVINVLGNDWRLEQLSLPVGTHRLYAQQYNYTAPPRREWIGLKADEESNLVNATWPIKGTLTDFLRAIEAKLKEKNT